MNQNIFMEQYTIPKIGSFAIDTTLLTNEYAKSWYPTIYRMAKSAMPNITQKACGASCHVCDTCRREEHEHEMRKRSIHGMIVDMDKDPINLYGEQKNINPVEPMMKMQDMAPKTYKKTSKTNKPKTIKSAMKKMNRNIGDNDEIEMAGLLSKYYKSPIHLEILNKK